MKMIDKNEIAKLINKIVYDCKIADIHTHLYDSSFGDLVMWGIDDLLTYHYLIAEMFRYRPDLPYETFWKMTKKEKAQLVWHEVFIKNSPVSEAASGVVIVLNKLGIDLKEKSLKKIHSYYSQIKIDDHIDKVFETANLKYVIMTNDPFDKKEQEVWEKQLPIDRRFLTALRLDGLLNDYENNFSEIKNQGFDVSLTMNEASIKGVKEFVEKWIFKLSPEYMAVSLPDDFMLYDCSIRCQLLIECILPLAEKFDLPLAMMIGVKRQINPLLQQAGDGLGRADISVISKLARQYPNVKFLITMLSRENQHELCITARKFRNIMPFGCWWFLNIPSIIEEMTYERIELLGLTMIPQHSDARVLDQLIYKWEHSRQVIAKVLTEKYYNLAQNGWSLPEEEIKRDVEKILGGGLLNQKK